MDWIIIAQGLCLIGLAFSLLTLWRNNQVKKFLDYYLEEEAAYTKERIKNGKGFDYFRRHKSLPDYCTMVFQLWKPLKSYRKPLSDFYKD